MKILTITNLYAPHAIGGYEERCRHCVEGLRRRGHEVHVLTSTHGCEGESREGAVERRLRIHGFFGHPWLPMHRLFALERHNHRVLREALATQRPDLVHVWNLGGLSKSLILTLQAWGGPVVYDVSDHWIARSLRADVWVRWWNGETGGLLAGVSRIILRATGIAALARRAAPFAAWSRFRFERVYFCSTALRSLTVAANWPVGHGGVIYCGVDTASFARRARNSRFSRMLYVGRLTDDKDPLTALRAVAKVRAAGYDVTLDLYGAGDDDYVAKLQAEAARPELAGAVYFRRATPAEMPAVYANYDALLFTSAWEEPFALTPLEAMAAGVPVIGTPSGGSRELFRHGQNALIFACRDAVQLAEGIRQLYSNPLLRNRIAETAQREVGERYDLGTVTNQIENYLEESRHGR